MGYYGGAGARKVATADAGRRRLQGQPADRLRRQQREHRARRLRHLGASRRAGRCRPPPSPASTSPTSSAPTRRGQPHRLRGPQRRQHSRPASSRPPTPPGRPTTAGAATASTPGSRPAAPTAVSYNRPFTTRGTPAAATSSGPTSTRWSATSRPTATTSATRPGVDTDRRGGLLTNHKAFLSVGHDEYWSGRQRTNVEAARDAGVNLAFFSGNEVFWKTRYEASVDGAATPYRTLVTLQGEHRRGPSTRTGTWTGTWRDPRFSPPGRRRPPGERLTGTIFTVNSGTFGIKVPAADGKMRFWRNTPVATQAAGRHGDAADRHAGLRVGRGPRQRVPAGRADPAVDHDVRRAGVAAGLRHRRRAGHARPTT